MATILLIEEDDDARPIIRQSLKRAGFEVLVALDEASASDWLAAGCVRADLVLVNLVGKTTEEAFAAARRVKRRSDIGGATPVVVIAEKYGDGLEGTDVQAGEGEWVTYMEDTTQLHGLLRRLTSTLSKS
jgi:DNA-binding response OmpR family regulator